MCVSGDGDGAVLNRAKPEKDPSKANKKTITGRTFERAY